MKIRRHPVESRRLVYHVSMPEVEPDPMRPGMVTRNEEEDVSKVIVSSHPIVQHKLAELRDVRTGPAEFRRLVRTLAVLLAQEATADLPTMASEVTTPLGSAPARMLADIVGIVPILRAGLGMAEGIIELLPEAEVWHHRLVPRRGHLAADGVLQQVPGRPRVTVALLVDPMLATGGSAVRACEIIKAAGVPRLKLLSLIAAPEGIARMNRAHARRADPRRRRRRAVERGRVHLSRARRRRRPPVRDRRRESAGESSEPAAHGDSNSRSEIAGGQDHDESRRHHSQEARWASTRARRRSPRWSRGSRPARSPTISGRPS